MLLKFWTRNLLWLVGFSVAWSALSVIIVWLCGGDRVDLVQAAFALPAYFIFMYLAVPALVVATSWKRR